MSPPASPVASRSQNSRWGTICMLLSIVFFTANSLTLGQSHISPWVALFFRAAVGMFFVATVFRGGGKVSFRRAATDRWLVCRGMLGVMGSVAYYFTIVELGAGKATLISNTYVVIAALMAVWFLNESFSVSKLLGNVLALFGLTLLIATPAQSVHFGWYEALAVFGAFMGAAAVVVIRKLSRTESSAIIYTSQCIYILVGSFPFAVYELYRQPIDTTNSIVLVLAGLSATIGQLTMTEGFRHLTVAVGGAFQICVPVAIAIGGVFLFDETFTRFQIAGAALILAGCYWVMVIR